MEHVTEIVFLLLLFLLIVLCVGEPDLLDAIIEQVRGECAEQGRKQ